MGNFSLEGIKNAYSVMVHENDNYMKEIDINKKILVGLNDFFNTNSLMSYDYTSKILGNLYNITMMEAVKFELEQMPYVNHFEILGILLGVYKNTDKNNINNKISKLMEAQILIHKNTNVQFVYSSLQHNIFNTLVAVLTQYKKYNFKYSDDATQHYEIIEDTLERLTREEKILVVLNFFEMLMKNSYMENASDKITSYANKLLDLNEGYLDGSFIMDVKSYICNTIIME